MELTPREKQVFDALTREPVWSSTLAQNAGITTNSPSETAAKYAIKLVAMGLAVRYGSASGSWPRWALSSAGLAFRSAPIPEPLPAVHSPHD